SIRSSLSTGSPTGRKWFAASWIAWMRLIHPAVTGAYQPYALQSGKRLPIGDPIPDYFPPIVTHADFAKVRERFEANRNRGAGSPRLATCSLTWSLAGIAAV